MAKSTLTLALFLLPSLISAACDRGTLSQTADRYVAAQSLGEIRYIKSLTPNTTYHEQFRPVPIGTGILATALKIDHRRSIYDTTQCASYTELIVTDKSHPYVIGTQIWHSASNSSEIAKIDSIVTDKEDWLFNASHTLYYALQENWNPISPESARDSRATIQAAGDAYLNLFKGGPGTVDVPWGESCRRLEGGLYTAPGDTCNSGVPSGVDLVDRRYVIDETLGVVDVFLKFGGGANGSGLPDSHEFRVEGGKLRFVHTITACWEKNCGFGDPPEILGTDLGF